MKVKVLFITYVLFSLLSLSCGLKIFYAIDPPVSAQRPNQADGEVLSSIVISENEQVFQFVAQDLSTSLFLNPGTDIYYRIYSNQIDLQDDAKIINDANDEDTNNGWKELINLNYKKIKSNENTTRLIDQFGGRITMRLSDTESQTSFIQPGTSIPLRNDDEFFHFDTELHQSDEAYQLPQEGDSDFDFKSGSSYFFVNAYAVSVGMDSSTFQEVQSEILSLGFTAYEGD